jgi:hypothetical protein
MKIILILMSVFFMSCETSNKRTGNCENYEPQCDFFGGRKECSYNSDGCKTCSCIPADNPNFKSNGH